MFLTQCEHLARRLKRRKLIPALLISFGMTACGGTKDEGGNQAPEPSIVAKTAGPMPLRRLNSREYDNTIKDLLRVNINASEAFQFTSDPTGNFHYPSITESISNLEVRKYREAAQSLSQMVNLGDLFSCLSGDNPCATQFIQDFGARAYRRPVTTSEASRLLGLYNDARTDPLNLSHEEGLRLLIEVMLQSPAFLYRWELEDGSPSLEDGLVKLSSYEMASRLSYFIWRSMPDDQLLQAAANNQLSTAAQIEAQARRLLADTKAREPVASFFEYWLTYSDLINIQKDEHEYPDFDESMKQAMLEEARTFVEDIVFENDGRFQTLFTSTQSYANSDLASIYVLSNIFGDSLQPVTLDDTQRGGLLTLSAFLADKGAAEGSNPALRGSALYRQMLCKPLPPPPNVIPSIEPPSAGGTTRDRFETHTSNPCASACHALFDPIGFAFEHYDGIGQYRTTDNGLSVDASSLIDLDGATHAFDGAVELSNILSDSATVKACFARQWMRYALDRNELAADEPSIEKLENDFINSGDIQELIVAITTSYPFMYRQPSTGEEVQ